MRMRMGMRTGSSRRWNQMYPTVYQTKAYIYVAEFLFSSARMSTCSYCGLRYVLVVFDVTVCVPKQATFAGLQLPREKVKRPGFHFNRSY